MSKVRKIEPVGSFVRKSGVVYDPVAQLADALIHAWGCPAALGWDRAFDCNCQWQRTIRWFEAVVAELRCARLVCTTAASSISNMGADDSFPNLTVVRQAIEKWQLYHERTEA